MNATINIVWFKRDFRLQDHRPLKRAIEEGQPVLLLGFLEPSLMAAPQSDDRHWRFVYESVADINERLEHVKARLHLLHAEVLPTLEALVGQYTISKIFSHAETGIALTYYRDKEVARFCEEVGIQWQETPYAGVIRGIKRRNNWPKHWYATMSSPTDEPILSKLKAINLTPSEQRALEAEPVPSTITTPDPLFQRGGEGLAHQLLQSFLSGRVANYNKHISRPHDSRQSCSRLSAHLAWGNLSMKQVYQAAAAAKKDSDQKWNINSFMSRLRWHCHFIQKFEMMDHYESQNINPAYDDLRTDWDEELYQAWEQGQTGYPLVDACMRCVRATGYLNFRMRSMVVSFLTHHLWLHWKRGADFLASQFLDFEPGIHYAQFQMQAGTTGFNTIRIYNPQKQQKDNDAEGRFVREWVPELVAIPDNLLTEPWTMTTMDQQMYGCVIGEDYPYPVADIKQTYRSASKALWAKKKDPQVKAEARKILATQNEKERAN